MTGSVQAAPRGSAHRLLTTIGGVGLIAVFLPFSWETTPAEAVREGELLRLALPAFLPFVILPATIRWLTTGSLSRLGTAVTYAFSVAAAGMIGLSYLRVDGWPGRAPEWIALVAPLLVLLFGGGALVRLRRDGPASTYRPIMAMQVVYIANAMLALASLFPDWQLGAYGVLVTVMAYAFQMDIVRKSR